MIPQWNLPHWETARILRTRLTMELKNWKRYNVKKTRKTQVKTILLWVKWTIKSQNVKNKTMKPQWTTLEQRSSGRHKVPPKRSSLLRMLLSMKPDKPRNLIKSQPFDFLNIYCFMFWIIVQVSKNQTKYKITVTNNVRQEKAAKSKKNLKA